MRGSQRCLWSRWASRKTTSSPPRPCKETWAAESIDFLDIVFRLEREFKIKIPERGELFSDPISPDDPVFARDGRLTDRGPDAALRSQMPYVDFTDLERDRRLNRIDDLFTVELLTSFIIWKLRGIGQERCSRPGFDQSATDGPHYPATIR